MKTLLLLAISLSFSIHVYADKTPGIVSPWEKNDGEWITISGKVTQSIPGRFTLDYGPGDVVVEFDGYGKSAERLIFPRNAQVRVQGRIDADQSRSRSIEAAAVFVISTGTSYFANADDEEDVLRQLRLKKRSGSVREMSGEIILVAPNFFTLKTTGEFVDVSTVAIAKGALGIRRKVKVREGDKVTVRGAMADGFGRATKFMATKVSKH